MPTPLPTRSRTGRRGRRRRRVDTGSAPLAQRLDPCPLGIGRWRVVHVGVSHRRHVLRARRRAPRRRRRSSWEDGAVVAVAAAAVPDVVSSTRASMLPSAARVAVNTSGAHAVGERELDVRRVGRARRPGPAGIGADRADHEGVARRIDGDRAGDVDEVGLGGRGGRRRRAGRDRCRCGAGRRHQVSGGGQVADLVVGGGVEDAEVGAHGERAGDDHGGDAACRDQRGAAVGKSLRHGTDGTDEHESGSPAVGKGLANGCPDRASPLPTSGSAGTGGRGRSEDLGAVAGGPDPGGLRRRRGRHRRRCARRRRHRSRPARPRAPGPRRPGGLPGAALAQLGADHRGQRPRRGDRSRHAAGARRRRLRRQAVRLPRAGRSDPGRRPALDGRSEPAGHVDHRRRCADHRHGGRDASSTAATPSA